MSKKLTKKEKALLVKKTKDNLKKILEKELEEKMVVLNDDLNKKVKAKKLTKEEKNLLVKKTKENLKEVLKEELKQKALELAERAKVEDVVLDVVEEQTDFLKEEIIKDAVKEVKVLLDKEIKKRKLVTEPAMNLVADKFFDTPNRMFSNLDQRIRAISVTGGSSILTAVNTQTGSFTHATGAFSSTFNGTGNWRWVSTTDNLTLGYNSFSINDTANTESISLDANSLDIVATQEVSSFSITTDAATSTVATLTADSLTTGKGMVVSSSGTHSDSLVELTSSGLQTGNTLKVNSAGTGNGVFIDKTGAAGTVGIALSVQTTADDQDAINLSAPSLTTATAIDIGNLDSLTTGKGINIVSNSGDISARSLVFIKNDNTAAVGTAPLSLSQDSTGPALSLARSTEGLIIQYTDGTDSVRVFNTAGTAEAVQTADIGSLNIDTTNGSLEMKTDDGDNTSWAPFMINKVQAEGTPPTFAWGALHPVDVSGAVQTLIVPALATIKPGDHFSVTDSRENASNFNITIDFTTNGWNLHGSSQDAVFNVNASSASFIYVSSAVGFIMKK